MAFQLPAMSGHIGSASSGVCVEGSLASSMGRSFASLCIVAWSLTSAGSS